MRKIFAALLAVALLALVACEGKSLDSSVTPNIPGEKDAMTKATELTEVIQLAEKALFAAPDGDDSASGTIDAPLRTLAGTRDAVRKLIADGIPDGGITVYFRGGEYVFAETVLFNESDSGIASAPVVYTAYPGETPVFTGGIHIDGGNFKSVTDETALARLRPEARDSVVSANLFELGLSYDDLDMSRAFWEAGNLREYVSEEYADNGNHPRTMQIFADGEALIRARYPNRTEGTFKENPYFTYLNVPRVTESGFDYKTELPNGKNARFITTVSHIRNWRDIEDIFVGGMLGWEFFYDMTRIKSFDPDTLEIELQGVPMSGIMENTRYAFENVFEELDASGEYYIDKHSGELYIYAETPPNGVSVSMLDTAYMADISGASFISFENLTFELTRGSALRIRGGESNAARGCTFRNLGINGVVIGEYASATRDLAAAYLADELDTDENTAARNGYRHEVTDCDFINTGFAACEIRSGDTLTRTPGNMLFENNLIAYSGLLGRAYCSGLAVDGVGITVKNNSFYYTLGQAIYGNVIDTEITYNEFTDCPADMAEDTCTIYLNYGGLNEGVLVRYNYFHDVTNRDKVAIGFGYARRSGVGYDNQLPFKDYCYNVAYRSSLAGTFFTAESQATAVGNLMVDIDYVLEWPPEAFRDGIKSEDAKEQLAEENYGDLGRKLYYDSRDAWRKYYPATIEWLEYIVNEKKSMLDTMSVVADNVCVNIEVPRDGRFIVIPESGVTVDSRYGRVENNHFMSSDPGLVDYTGRNPELTQSAADKLGVPRLDLSLVGADRTVPSTRLEDLHDDPMSGKIPDTHFAAFLNGAEFYDMFALYREVTPGVWEWVSDGMLNSEAALCFVL